MKADSHFRHMGEFATKGRNESVSCFHRIYSPPKLSKVVKNLASLHMIQVTDGMEDSSSFQ